MLDWSQCPAVERSPDRVSGAWVFRGTRVPVAALFENLESGARVEEFLEWFQASPVSKRKRSIFRAIRTDAFDGICFSPHNEGT